MSELRVDGDILARGVPTMGSFTERWVCQGWMGLSDERSGESLDLTKTVLFRWIQTFGCALIKEQLKC